MNTYTIAQELTAHNITNYTSPEGVSIEPTHGDWIPEVRVSFDGTIFVTATREDGEVFPDGLYYGELATEADIVERVKYILSFNR